MGRAMKRGTETVEGKKEMGEMLQVKTTLLRDLKRKEFSCFLTLHWRLMLHPLTGDISVTVKSTEIKHCLGILLPCGLTLPV